MYKVELYFDEKGRCPIREFLQELNERAKTNKDARVQLKQLLYSVERLKQSGTRAGKDITKHIEGDIWELRPGNNRVFFFGWKGNTFVLLHSFRKKSQKTPQKEIDQAKREMEDWIRRHGS